MNNYFTTSGGDGLDNNGYAQSKAMSNSHKKANYRSTQLRSSLLALQE